jgi:hypothetical protein
LRRKRWSKLSAKTTGRKIENEEQYQNSLAWLVTKSIEIEDPLIDPEKKEKLMRQYDFVAERVQEYRRGELVQMFPSLREVYAKLGWNYDDRGAERPELEPMGSVPEPEAPKQPEPIPDPEPKPAKPAVSISAWLDDDD